MIETRWGSNPGTVAVRWTIGILALAAIAGVSLGRDRLAVNRPDPAPAWARRIARVDAALQRSDVSQAIYQWREAYGAAVRANRADGLIAVAHGAVRIAERAGGSGYFLGEARYIYQQAAFRARAERSPQAIRGIAEAFDRLGDTERASHVRRIAGPRS